MMISDKIETRSKIPIWRPFVPETTSTRIYSRISRPAYKPTPIPTTENVAKISDPYKPVTNIGFLPPATDISRTHLIGCSCHITLSANTCHLCCDIRIRMRAPTSAVSFTSLRASRKTPFPSLPIRHQQQMPWPAMRPQPPLHAGSRLLPATFRCGVCRPTVPSPHPPPLTVYAGKTGEVQSIGGRFVYRTGEGGGV